MFEEIIQEVFNELGGSYLPLKDSQAVRRAIAEKLAEKNYHKSIIFECGYLMTVIVLRNYDDNREDMMEAFIHNFMEEGLPKLKLKWDFSSTMFCTKLLKDKCSFTGKKCLYQGRFPHCNRVHESLRKKLYSKLE